MRRPADHDTSVRADLDFWRDLSGGDDHSARELVALFLTNTSEHIAHMVSGLAAGNAEAVCRAAHTCIGSCRTCGLEGLADLFRQLEQEAGEKRLDALSHTVPRIVETFDEVHARLTRAIATPSSATFEECQ
jgi:HPt (histidine-containing phosphotransfer) domain-containing protein